MVIVFFILWLLYSVVDAKREAMADAWQQQYSFEYKHVIYTFGRFLMATALTLCFFYFMKQWFTPCIFFMISLVLGFSFLHDGIYCVCRNRFADRKVYPKGFMDRGSTAFFDFSFPVRTVMMVVSLLFIVLLALWC